MKLRDFTISLTSAIAATLCLFVSSGSPAFAHEANLGNNLAQNYISHPDASISAAAAPALLLAANPARVTAVCQNLGTTNPARLGDASIGASQRTTLSPGGAATFDVTGALYGFSAAGTSINCGEIVRP